MQRILIVDDNRMFLEKSKRALSRAGLQIHDAETAAKAMEIANNNQIDLIVLDFNLPDLNANELVRELGADRPYLFITGASFDNPDFLDLPDIVYEKPQNSNFLRDLVFSKLPRLCEEII